MIILNRSALTLLLNPCPVVAYKDKVWQTTKNSPKRLHLAAPVAERSGALFLNHSITAVSGVGSSPALATCETSKVLLAGVSGGFSRGSPVFAPPTDWPVSYELTYNIERDVKLKKKKKKKNGCIPR